MTPFSKLSCQSPSPLLARASTGITGVAWALQLAQPLFCPATAASAPGWLDQYQLGRDLDSAVP